MRIERLILRSPAPAALHEFYRRAFDASAWEFGVAVGEERIEIEPCADAPADVFPANETGFQHFAIVVADMNAAIAQLCKIPHWRAISLGGPERLPKASGGATAFKFRDPDGHPLELLEFAPGSIPATWKMRFAAQTERVFHGIDHSALTVRDAEASQRFYLGLGFTASRRQINVGPEQARLDGFAERDEAKVAIVSLSPSDDARPGVELLEYRRPTTVVHAAADGAAAASRLVISEPSGGLRPERDLDGHRLGYTPATA